MIIQVDDDGCPGSSRTRVESKPLTEPVEIWSVNPPRKLYNGQLVVGTGYLPELVIPVLDNPRIPDVYGHTPRTFAAAWELRPVNSYDDHPLLMAWQAIRDIQSGIARAEGEAEAEDCDIAG